MGAKAPPSLKEKDGFKAMQIRFPLKLIRKKGKQLALLLLAACVGISLLLFAMDRWISLQTETQVYQDIEQLPPHDVALVLGTSKYIGRTLNTYYSHRIKAAIDLYEADKVKFFLLSGDNAHRSYNEPWTMKRDLLKEAIPEQAIHLDYAGFRTLDSVIRAKEIFDADNFVIITQAFHCERALYIANYHNIDAVCLAVPGPTGKAGLYVRFREVFARAKALLDLYILDKQPKYLGPKEPILDS